MQYRTDPKSGNRLSALGLGCMRFPRGAIQIDYKKSEKLVLDAIEAGVNYFDMAYVYMGSEEILGQILRNNPGAREKIFLATKLPLGMCKSYGDFDRLFNTQLERLGTDYIDYYFMHNLSSKKRWDNLCALGIESWIAGKKSEGKIKLAGFSFHGSQGEFFALLDAYDWDFCQIQYNYANINYQAGVKGLKAAAEKGLPVIIMEPLLGGKLATGLPKGAVNLFKEVDGSKAPVSWALNWLWNQPEVTVVLSGMSTAAQLKENAALAEAAYTGMLSEKEEAVYDKVLDAFNKSYEIPCTGCNYCMPCPQDVNIPACFSAYNMYRAVGFATGMMSYVTSTAAVSREHNFLASRCVRCGKCEKECPQHIKITDELSKVQRHMEPFWFKPAMSLLNRLRME